MTAFSDLRSLDPVSKDLGFRVPKKLGQYAKNGEENICLDLASSRLGLEFTATARIPLYSLNHYLFRKKGVNMSHNANNDPQSALLPCQPVILYAWASIFPNDVNVTLERKKKKKIKPVKI